MGEQPFRHLVMPYVGESEFVGSVMPFIQSGVAADEPVLVVASASKGKRLRSELGADAAHVEFALMSEVGHNPASIIPAWRDFVDRFQGRPVRGIGEPIYPERTGAALVESLHHEALLNLAFDDRPEFSLLCPIDVEALGDAAVEQSLRRHPWMGADGARSPATGCRENHGYESGSISATLDDPLPAPSAPFDEVNFDMAMVGEIRSVVSRTALARGVSTRRTFDLTTAVNEAVTNSIVHGGGFGTLRVWSETDRVICEVSDRGRIDDPLIGRRRPPQRGEGNRGVWMMNQLCDLVQVRSGVNGTVVRLHSELAGGQSPG